VNEATPRELRLAEIDKLRSDAAKLLDKAKHRTLQEQIRLARLDLDDAFDRLHEPRADTSESILTIADMSITLATWRLNTIGDALRRNGPHAKISG
jgi:hypothetical protein